MKYPINGDFEKLILEGCRVIKKASVNFDITNGDITHILLECPKDYRKDEDKSRKDLWVKFITIEWGHDFTKPSWYEATLYFSSGTKSYALKGFNENLREDARYRRLSKENQNS